MAKRLRVYLAGPMTGCNEEQRTKWRKNVKRGLQKIGHEALDPTAATAREGVMAVAADIEEADIVIANMWRESIGTVLGIVHAQRLGIPVILIDRNYTNSSLLEALVDKVVRDEDAAVNFLEHEFAKVFQQTITVTKKQKSGAMKEEHFVATKLQRALKASCTLAGIDDPVFCTRLFQRVKRSIFSAAEEQKISSEKIRALIFHELTALASENTGLRPSDQESIQRQASILRTKWEDYEFNKELSGEQQSSEEFYLQEIETLCEENAQLKLELSALRGKQAPTPEKPTRDVSAILAAQLQELLRNRRALCVGRLGRGTFKSVFERVGLSSDDFDRFFIENPQDGRQSNLNSDLKSSLAQYSYVLYAGKDLRHISDPKLREASNFISGFGPADAVRRLLSQHS